MSDFEVCFLCTLGFFALIAAWVFLRGWWHDPMCLTCRKRAGKVTSTSGGDTYVRIDFKCGACGREWYHDACA